MHVRFCTFPASSEWNGHLELIPRLDQCASWIRNRRVSFPWYWDTRSGFPLQLRTICEHRLSWCWCPWLCVPIPQIRTKAPSGCPCCRYIQRASKGSGSSATRNHRYESTENGRIKTSLTKMENLYSTHYRFIRLQKSKCFFLVFRTSLHKFVDIPEEWFGSILLITSPDVRNGIVTAKKACIV